MLDVGAAPGVPGADGAGVADSVPGAGVGAATGVEGDAEGSTGAVAIFCEDDSEAPDAVSIVCLQLEQKLASSIFS